MPQKCGSVEIVRMSRFEYVVGGNAEKGAQPRQGGESGLCASGKILRQRGFGHAYGVRDFGLHLSGKFYFGFQIFGNFVFEVHSTLLNNIKYCLILLDN